MRRFILIALIVIAILIMIIIPKWVISSPDLVSPHPRIGRDQIHFYADKVIIDVKNPQWAMFADTNSMDPVFDAGHYAVEVVPQQVSDIHVGDIVSYESASSDTALVHRVMSIGDDGEWYAVIKGDNNLVSDPGKVRFSQIRRVIAVIIY
mgnify:CR=1 FL=1